MPELPRLLYVADVPVEASYHGSALMYRLLEDYPPERLLIVEAGDLVSDASRRLSGCRYHRVAFPAGALSPLASTRLSGIATSLQLFIAQYLPSRVMTLAGQFAPDAVLSVAHGYSWLSAARVARRLGVALHLVVHDDPEQSITVPSALHPWLDERFKNAYRMAASRLCISPAMEEEYRRRYGVEGTVLYPSQGPGSIQRGQARSTVENAPQLTMGYAGSLLVGDYRRALRVAAESLQAVNGRLLVYGPSSPAELKACALDLPNVVLRGLIPNSQIINTLKHEVDLLFLPMSFEPAQQAAATLCFPSKLADYTAATLPILIRGPAYSSAVRWAMENPGAAEVVTSPADEELTAALDRLRSHPYRNQLAAKAFAVGQKMFERHMIQRQFHDALRSALPTARSGE